LVSLGPSLSPPFHGLSLVYSTSLLYSGGFRQQLPSSLPAGMPTQWTPSQRQGVQSWSTPEHLQIQLPTKAELVMGSRELS
jgi:hypothetical protein